MKANELMIGDWVKTNDLYKAIKDVKVRAISQYSIEDETTNQWVECQHIEPIPITAEILEKNGFRTFGLINAPKYGLWLNDGRIIELSRIDNGWRIWVFYNNIPMSLNYLHELQHALRLCGITHEIVL